MWNLSRNETEGLLGRTLKNLFAIEAAFASGQDVHVVTQLVTSLLALVVFPWEREVFRHAEEEALSELVNEGWPKWHFVEGHSDTLDELIRNLRHGIAHSNVAFSSDSRNVGDVVIEVANYPKHRPAWKVQIRGDELREFCLHLAKYIRDIVE